ncbi:MAG: hypothetical protein QOE46_1273 [Acidobacteriota bacterium]|jgi:hypothetical protein|nr:hypothetical protein [Acidobacteriota bacterium]
MRLFKYCVAFAVLLVAVSPALADVALPGKERVRRNDEIRGDLPYSQMTIESVEGLREVRLQIPRSQFARMSAAAGIVQDDAGVAQAGTLKNAGTVIAGLFLSLAVVLTGLLLVRSRRRVAVGRAAVALLVCVCAAAVAAVAAYANAAPPVGWRAQDPGTLLKAVSGKSLTGSIRIEVVEEGSGIKLLIPAKSHAGEEEE